LLLLVERSMLFYRTTILDYASSGFDARLAGNEDLELRVHNLGSQEQNFYSFFCFFQGLEFGTFDESFSSVSLQSSGLQYVGWLMSLELSSLLGYL